MTAPWRAPDGRPWFERWRGQGVPMALSLGYHGLVRYRPNRTRMAWAVHHICPDAALASWAKPHCWWFGFEPWEF